MWVWIVLRCFFEILAGAAGLVRHFGDCQSVYDVANALFTLNDDGRVVVVIFAALAVGGVVEIGFRLFRAIKH